MRSKVGLSAVAAGVPFFLIVAFVLFSETVLPFTDHLRQDALAGDGEHTVRFFRDEEEDKVASVYVRHGQAEGGLYRMMVEVWHEGDTVLDSLSVQFNALRPARALRLETPSGYPWPSLEYRSTLGPGRNDVTGGVIVNIPDLEFQGTGTVSLVFYLRTDLVIPAPPQELSLDVAFSMHSDGLPKLTKQEGEAAILLELAPRPAATIAFEELFSAPGRYSGTDVLLEGFYFQGWETIVLSERLEPTGRAEGHLWPQGEMLWIEGEVPREIYDQVSQQDMMGPTERYGKVRITGRFEYGAGYGHGGGFTAQIVPSEVELLPWSPASQQLDDSIPNLKYRLIEHFGGVIVGDPVIVPDDVRREQARSVFATIQSDGEEFQAILRELGLMEVTSFSVEQQVLVFEEKKKLNVVRLQLTDSGHSFELVVREDGDPLTVSGVVEPTGEITILTKAHALLPR